jgi:NAD(P)-dependent dehydrogenase (short-subunit alcohol dehydrogenase family)
MTSPHWDEARAAAYREFRFEFPEKTLAGRTIVVAGGTGGLGAAIVVLLAGEGAHLVVGYRENRDRAERLRDATEREAGSKIELVEGDLCDAGVRRQYLEKAGEFGAPMAGAAIYTGDPARLAFSQINREAMVASLESNYVGPVLLAKDLGEAMEGEKIGGSIVLLATMQAVAPFSSSLNYAAPKAALVHAARILAQQWNRVRVNLVAPGATISGMASASVQSGKYDKYLENGAISRFGRPEDVARAVRFLLEPDNYITGQTILVDGGLTLRRDR